MPAPGHRQLAHCRKDLRQNGVAQGGANGSLAVYCVSQLPQMRQSTCGQKVQAQVPEQSCFSSCGSAGGQVLKCKACATAASWSLHGRKYLAARGKETCDRPISWILLGWRWAQKRPWPLRASGSGQGKGTLLQSGGACIPWA